MSGIDWHNLNWVDYCIIGLIAFSALISLIRGFVREAVSLATWVAAFFAAFKFSTPLSDYFADTIQSPTLRLIIIFAVIFFFVLLLGAIFNFMLSQMVDRTGLSGTDRILGIIFGVTRGVFLVGVFILLGNITTFNKDTWWSNSQLIPHFQGLSHWLQSFVPEQFENLKKMHGNSLHPANNNTMQIQQQ